MKYGYGEERATPHSALQRLRAAELCRARNRLNKGKTYEQIYGATKGAELRERARVTGRAIGDKMRGKTMEELYGEERAEAIKEKLRNAAIKQRRSYISEEEKMIEATWKVMLLPSVKPWRSSATDSRFCREREFITSGAGRRW